MQCTGKEKKVAKCRAGGEAGQGKGNREKLRWAGILNAGRLSIGQTKGLVFKV